MISNSKINIHSEEFSVQTMAPWVELGAHIPNIPLMSKEVHPLLTIHEIKNLILNNITSVNIEDMLIFNEGERSRSSSRLVITNNNSFFINIILEKSLRKNIVHIMVSYRGPEECIIDNYIIDNISKIFNSIPGYDTNKPSKESLIITSITEDAFNHSGLNVSKIEVYRNDLSNIQEYMFPYMDVDKMLTSFLHSTENLLILSGPPGTGKTSIIKLMMRKFLEEKELISDNDTNYNSFSMSAESCLGSCHPSDSDIIKSNEHMSMSYLSNAIYLKDESLLIKNKIWNIISNINPGLIILDDLDNALSPRSASKDNTFVSNLLSYTNGVFPNTTKIIITTNLPLTSIDSALVRPGRCFDILYLPELTYPQALDIWVNHMKRTEKIFKDIFPKLPKNTGITPAQMISEAMRLDSNARSYLHNPAISIRDKFMN